MDYDSILKTLLLLAAGLSTWVAVRLTNERFRSERALLIFKKLERDGRGDVSLTVANIGRRPALAVRLSQVGGDWRHYEDGLAADDAFKVQLPRSDDTLSIEFSFVDAGVQRPGYVIPIAMAGTPTVLPGHASSRSRALLARLGLGAPR